MIDTTNKYKAKINNMFFKGDAVFGITYNDGKYGMDIDLEGAEFDMPVEIKKLIASINLRLSLIGNLPEDKMRNCTRILMHINDPEKEGEDFWLISKKSLLVM